MSKRNWCFTENDAERNLERFTAVFGGTPVSYAVFQTERGGSTGREHLQGYIELEKPMRLSEVKKLLGSDTVHLESRRGNRVQARDYCRKSDSRINGPFEFGTWARQGKRSDLASIAADIRHGTAIEDLGEEYDAQLIVYRRGIEKLARETQARALKIELLSEYKDVAWREWQQEIIDKCGEKPDSRRIHWYVDELGNTGKSFLAKFLGLGGAFVCSNAKTADLCYAYQGEPVVLFDLERSCEESFNYQVLERLKNGTVFSSKYESGTRYFRTPHLFVFANWYPEKSKLSLDRWDINKIVSL